MSKAPRRKPRQKTPEEIKRDESMLEFRDAFYKCMTGLGFKRAEGWRTPGFLSCVTKDDVEINATGFMGKKRNMKLRVNVSIPITDNEECGRPPSGFTNVLGFNHTTFPFATVWINSASEVCDKIDEIMDLYEKARGYIEKYRDNLMGV
jgi:hypothetical protein